MENNWVKVYSTNQLYQAEITKAVLKDHDIDTVILNKQDSAYVPIGEVELYATKDNALKASHLIQKHEL